MGASMQAIADLGLLAKQYSYVWIPALILLGLWVWGRSRDNWRGPE